MKIKSERIIDEINHKGLKRKDVAKVLNMDEAAFSAALKRGGLSEERVGSLAKLLQVDYQEIIDIGLYNEDKTILREFNHSYLAYEKEIEYLKTQLKDKIKIIELQDRELSMYRKENREANKAQGE